jgi:hypothetical protein
MKQCSFQNKTFEMFIKVKGEIMVVTGRNPTHDEVLVFLIDEHKNKRG